MNAERIQLTVEGYLAEVLALVTAPMASEDVPLGLASGRVLAAPVTSRGPVPAFANSAMDGFAVRYENLAPGVVLREVADVPAGSSEDPPVPPCACVRIMTGAPVPTQADTIVPRELVTELGDGGIRIESYPERGTYVRHPGEDLATGDVVLPAGRTLDARTLALAAACGRATVAVAGRPRVAVASTGDELIAPGGDLARGQIYESNSTFLSLAAAAAGADVTGVALLPDDPDAFARGLDALASDADLIVLSGGVSVGDYDVVRIVLTERAGGVFRSVHLQPGKPQGWARWGAPDGRRVPVVALPGNPLSSAVSFELFVRPVIDALLGRLDRRPDGPAVAREGWTSPAGRRQVVPVTLATDADGVRTIAPAHRRGSQSHLVSALSLADALAFVPEEVTTVAPGDVLQIRSLT